MSNNAPPSTDGASGAPEPYDVVVVGGGIVGSLVAAEAARIEGYRVALVEPRPAAPLADLPVGEEDAPDLRVFAITPSSARALDAVGAWERVLGARAKGFAEMQVWEGMGSGFVRFHASAVSGSAGQSVMRSLRSVGVSPDRIAEAEPVPESATLAHIVEQRVIASALGDVLREMSESDPEALTMFAGASLDNLTIPSSPGAGSLAHLTLNTGEALSARLVVAADGANSAVRSRTGMGTWGWEYEQKGVVCTVRTERPSQTAWQRFLPSGPVALLPLWDDLSSIVWSLPTAEADRVLALPEDEMLAELNAALRDPPSSHRSHSSRANPSVGSLLTGLMAKADRAVGGLTAAVAGRLDHMSEFQTPPLVVSRLGKGGAFPLRLSGASTYTRPRVALVGDAAHTVHPLAGQGLNLGIADAAGLADALKACAQRGGDPGLAALPEYDASRRASVTAMMGVIDGIKRLYSSGGNDPNPLSLARTLGMGALNALPPLKREIVLFAMGGQGSLLSSVLTALSPADASQRRKRGSFDWL